MRLCFIQAAGAIAVAVSLCAQEPKELDQKISSPPGESQGLPPRAGPSDYSAQVKAGNVTIAAEFDGNAIPTTEGPLSTDKYVVVETALFGPGTLQLSSNDFSLRINGKKAALASQSYVLVQESVKDPNWAPPEKQEKSKTSFGTGGGDTSSSTPEPVKVPFELQRAMAQHVKQAALPEGGRTLPQAGLLFFPYRGKVTGIHSIELIYSGPAGNATLALQP